MMEKTLKMPDITNKEEFEFKTPNYAILDQKISTILTFYLLSLTFSWIVWIPMAIFRDAFANNFFLLLIGQSLGGISPIITLIILQRYKKCRLLHAIFTYNRGEKINPGCYIVSVIIFPLFAIFISYIRSILSITNEFLIFNAQMFNEMGFLIVPSIIGYYAMGLIGSSLFEEPGWRGFVLPNLQQKFGKVLGSLIVGSYWWIWHLPLWLVYGFEISLFDYLIFISFSFLIDSIFNMAKRKIYVAMLLHSSLATSELYFIGFVNDIYSVIILWSIILIFRIIETKIK